MGHFREILRIFPCFSCSTEFVFGWKIGFDVEKTDELRFNFVSTFSSRLHNFLSTNFTVWPLIYNKSIFYNRSSLDGNKNSTEWSSTFFPLFLRFFWSTKKKWQKKIFDFNFLHFSFCVIVNWNQLKLSLDLI